jgi:hypothetical protein
LQEFTRHQARLRDRQIDVLALSVDDVVISDSAGKTSDAELIERLRFPFRSGRIDRNTIEKCQLLHDTLFDLHTPLPIPTSFLLERHGRVTAIYKGPVTVDQLLADVARLGARTTEEWRNATLPFSGRWFMPPRRRHLFEFVSQLAERGYFVDCARYVKDNKAMFATHPRWPELERRIRDGLKAR